MLSLARHVSEKMGNFFPNPHLICKFTVISICSKAIVRWKWNFWKQMLILPSKSFNPLTCDLCTPSCGLIRVIRNILQMFGCLHLRPNILMIMVPRQQWILCSKAFSSHEESLGCLRFRPSKLYLIVYIYYIAIRIFCKKKMGSYGNVINSFIVMCSHKISTLIK